MATERRTALLGGRYDLGEPVGDGGMGRVYRARDTKLSRVVAVKVLHPTLAGDEQHRARFEREARLAARLNHPSVVAVYDVGQDRDEQYIVMEWLAGGTLADRLLAGPMDARRVHQMAVELLAGLGLAHEHGILHRDIKPSNVLFGADGTAKLGDFGIATDRDSLDLTATGLLIGTVRYLAPERLAGHPATEAGDQYALGVVLREALWGPPAGPNTEPIAPDAVGGSGPSATRAEAFAAAGPDSDPALVSAIGRAVRPDPTERFPTTRAMAAAIADDDSTAPIPVGPAGVAAVAGLPPALTAAPADATSSMAPGATVVQPYPVHAPDEVAAPAGPRSRRRRGYLVGVAAMAIAVGLVGFLALSRGDDGTTGTGSTTSVPASVPASPSTVAPAKSPSPPTTTRPTTTTTKPRNNHSRDTKPKRP